MSIQTSWETNHEIKQTFSLDSDIDVEKKQFFNLKLNLLMNNSSN